MRWAVRLLVICVACLGAACGKPRPRTVETIEAEPEKSVRPSYLDQVEMPRRQRARVNAELHRLYVAFEDYDSARLELLDEVVAQVEKGELIREDLVPLAEETVAAFDRGYPTLLSVTNRLHELLTPDQRRELIHRLVGDEDQRQRSSDERRAAREERLANVLDLSAGQRARIYPALAVLALKYWGLMSHYRQGVREAAEAFVQEDFDARELSLAQEHRLWEVGEAFFEALELAVEVLTAEQRRTLAALMKQRYS